MDRNICAQEIIKLQGVVDSILITSEVDEFAEQSLHYLESRLESIYEELMCTCEENNDNVNCDDIYHD